MRLMLLICHDSSFTARTVKGASAAWLEEMERRGVRKHGDRLRPAAEAKTVSMRDGKLVVRDGPFAETKDEVAGYDIVECRFRRGDRNRVETCRCQVREDRDQTGLADLKARGTRP